MLWVSGEILAGTEEQTHPRLSELVQKYVATSDSREAESLKTKILAHPQATIELVERIIKAGPLYKTEPVGAQSNRQIQIRGRTFGYGLYVPQSYTPSTAYPLIVCLHGAGFTGDTYLERWQPRLKEHFILVCPTLGHGAWWTRLGEDLVLAVMRAVRERYRIDPNQVFLTGMSNGGIGAWIIGMHHADLFAGVAPMASGIDEVLYPFVENLGNTSVYVLHGAYDQVMPVGLSRDLVKEMRKLGIHHVYREHELTHPHAGGHFFPREELPALVTWFDHQERNPLPRHVIVVRDATHLMSFSWVRIDATDRIAAFSENLIDHRDEYIKGRVYARLEAKIDDANHITVNTSRVKRYTLFLNKELIDLSKSITIETNGKMSYQNKVTPQLDTLLHEARLRQDPKLLFPVQLTLKVP